MLHADLIAPIPELLKRHARERGGKVAYRDAQSSVTYAQLEERTARLAAHLADRGIAAGDTIAILLPNSTQWIETCFATARAGAIGVPVSYDASEPEIAYRLEDANCRAIVTTAERGDLVAKHVSIHCVEFGSRIATASPAAMPRSARCAASRAVRSSSCA